MEIQTNTTLPHIDAMDALHASLATSLGNIFQGVSARKGKIVIHLADNATGQQQADAQQLVQSHDMNSRTDEQQAIVAAANILSQAETNVRNIPGWASWDEATALQWVTTNVTDLASAKTALLALTRMVIALRDAQWPGLNAES